MGVVVAWMGVSDYGWAQALTFYTSTKMLSEGFNKCMIRSEYDNKDIEYKDKSLILYEEISIGKGGWYRLNYVRGLTLIASLEVGCPTVAHGYSDVFEPTSLVIGYETVMKNVDVEYEFFGTTKHKDGKIRELHVVREGNDRVTWSLTPGRVYFLSLVKDKGEFVLIDVGEFIGVSGADITNYYSMLMVRKNRALNKRNK